MLGEFWKAFFFFLKTFETFFSTFVQKNVGTAACGISLGPGVVRRVATGSPSSCNFVIRARACSDTSSGLRRAKTHWLAPPAKGRLWNGTLALLLQRLRTPLRPPAGAATARHLLRGIERRLTWEQKREIVARGDAIYPTSCFVNKPCLTRDSKNVSLVLHSINTVARSRDKTLFSGWVGVLLQCLNHLLPQRSQNKRAVCFVDMVDF